MLNDNNFLNFQLDQISYECYIFGGIGIWGKGVYIVKMSPLKIIPIFVLLAKR